MEKGNFSRMGDKSDNRFILFEAEKLNQLIFTINNLSKEVKAMKSDLRVNVIYTNKTIKDVLGVQDKLLKKYRDDGLLAFHQVGDKYRYTQADVDQFLSANRFEAYSTAC